MSAIPFNVNYEVRVKLTDVGRAAHRKNHDKLFAFAKTRLGAEDDAWKYRAPEEDTEGWSKWQLWVLMKEFGPHITMGMTPPFETAIELIPPVQSEHLEQPQADGK